MLRMDQGRPCISEAPAPMRWTSGTYWNNNQCKGCWEKPIRLASNSTNNIRVLYEIELLLVIFHSSTSHLFVNTHSSSDSTNYLAPLNRTEMKARERQSIHASAYVCPLFSNFTDNRRCIWWAAEKSMRTLDLWWYTKAAALQSFALKRNLNTSNCSLRIRREKEGRPSHQYWLLIELKAVLCLVSSSVFAELSLAFWPGSSKECKRDQKYHFRATHHEQQYNICAVPIIKL